MGKKHPKASATSPEATRADPHGQPKQQPDSVSFDLADPWLRLFMDAVPDGVNLREVDPETGKHRLVMCNDRYVEMSGRTREELMSADDIRELEGLFAVKQGYRRRKARGLPRGGTSTWLRPDGKKNAYEWVTYPVTVNGKPHVLGIDRDISDRIKTVESSSRQQSQLDMVLANSFDGISICVVDERTKGRRLVTCNDRFVEMSGRSRQELEAAENIADLSTEISEELTSPDGIHVRGKASWNRPDGKENYYEYVRSAINIDGKLHFMSVDRDITERVKAERELADYRERLDAIMATISDGIIMSKYYAKGKAKLVMCNDQYAEMSGYTREQLMAAEDINELSEAISLDGDYQEKKAKNLPRGGISRRLRPDGKENYAEWRSRTVTIAGQRYVVASNRDITERVKAERELASYRRRLETIMANVSDGIAVTRYVGADNRLVMCNDRYVEMSGRTREELMAAKSLDELTEAISFDADYWERKEKNLPRGGMGRWFRPDGKENYYEWRIIAVEIDGERHFVSTHRDVTQRVLTERELASYRRRLETIMATASDGISVSTYSPRGQRLVMCNDQYVEMSGYTREQLMAAEDVDKLSELVSLCPDYGQRKAKNLPRGGTGRWLRPDGKENYYEWRTRSVVIDGQRHNVTTHRDVTDRVVAERKFREAHRRLEDIIEFLPDGTFVTDREGKVIAWNRAMEEMTGTRKEHIIGKTADACSRAVYGKVRPLVIDLLNAKDEEIAAWYERFERRGTTLMAEGPVPSPDGNGEHYRWAVAAPLLDANGNTIGAIESTRDMTQRRRMELAIKQSEEVARDFSRQLEILHEVGMVMSRAATSKELCRMAVELGMKRLGFDRIGIWLAVKDKPNTFVGTFGTAENGQIEDGSDMTFTVAEGSVLADVVSGRLPVAVLHDAPLWARGGEQVGTGTVVKVPLWDGENVIGYVSMDNLIRQEPITERQIELLRLFASNLGHSYTRKKEEELLRVRQVAIDSAVNPIAMADLDGRLTYVNQAFVKSWGYDSADQVIGRPATSFWQDEEHARAVMEGLLQDRSFTGELAAKRKDGSLFDVYLGSHVVTDENGKAMCQMAWFVDLTERKRLEKRAAEAGMMERRKIGQDLHDSLGQMLTGIAFMTKVLEENLSDKSLPEAADAARISRNVDKAISMTRSLARGLFPTKLAVTGLRDALEELARDTVNMFGVSCKVKCDRSALLPNDAAAANLYYIVQEAVHNAIRHAEAKEIRIYLASSDGGDLALTVKDDGKGVSGLAGQEEGMGVRSMRYRAGLIGGKLEVRSRKSGGTIVTCSFPGAKVPQDGLDT